MGMNRKTLLKLAGAAIASGVSFLYPGLTGLAGATSSGKTSRSATTSSAVTMVGPDPTFATGRVVLRTAEGVILDPAAGARAVRIPTGTVVWKEFLLPSTVIEVGDWLDVKGTPLADGSFLARSEWVFVNIGRQQGVVVSASDKGLTIKHNKGTQTLELSPALEVITARTGAAIPGGVRALVAGTPMGAVGLRLPNGGFRATKVWI